MRATRGRWREWTTHIGLSRISHGGAEAKEERRQWREVKSQQAEVMRILDSKSIKYELIDISVGGAVRDEMRSKSGNPTAIPPQIFNEDQYCGNYEMFSEAVEADTVDQFLKIA
ncbi:SH3 domain-binding glutamic acid-rich-like protein [Pimephales promelas]|nr:SH3 domain-binding glutamic acid-rich-like protein [Pimephales promelas]